MHRNRNLSRMTIQSQRYFIIILNFPIIYVFLKPGYHFNSLAYQQLRGMRSNIIQYAQVRKYSMEKHTGVE